jgi:hypothetical protein
MSAHNADQASDVASDAEGSKTESNGTNAASAGSRHRAANAGSAPNGQSVPNANASNTAAGANSAPSANAANATAGSQAEPAGASPRSAASGTPAIPHNSKAKPAARPSRDAKLALNSPDNTAAQTGSGGSAN